MTEHHKLTDARIAADVAAGQTVQAVIITNSNELEHEFVNVRLIRLFIARYRVLIGALTLIGALSGFALSFAVDKQYRAEVVVASAAAEQAVSPLSALASQYGALASFAGINLPTGDEQAAVSIAMLRSRKFIEDLIREHDLLPILFADMWDASSGSWKVKSGESPPTLEDGYDLFRTKILTVDQDKKSSLISVRVRWRDREKAAEWANLLVARLNAAARDAAVSNAQRSIEFLNRELERTTTVELRQSIYSLMQSQLNKIMMANARPDFAFNVIDPAQPPGPNRYIFPKRSAFAAGGVILGMLIGVCVGLVHARSGRNRA